MKIFGKLKVKISKGLYYFYDLNNKPITGTCGHHPGLSRKDALFFVKLARGKHGQKNDSR